MSKQTNIYLVYIKIPSVDSFQQERVIKCKLSRDKEDGLLYLIDINTKGVDFRELFIGENKKEYYNDEIQNFEDELDKLRARKKKLDKDSIENYKNIDRKILEIEFVLEKNMEERGSFVWLNEKGEKCIDYIRKSTGLHPLHYNIHSNNAFVPTEADSRDAFLSWKEKYKALQDNKDKTLKTIATIFGVFVGAIILLSLGWGSYKVSTYNVEKQDALMEQKFICQEIYERGLTEIIKSNVDTANNLNKLSKNITFTQDKNFLDSFTDKTKVTAEILN